MSTAAGKVKEIKEQIQMSHQLSILSSSVRLLEDSTTKHKEDMSKRFSNLEALMLEASKLADVGADILKDCRELSESSPSTSRESSHSNSLISSSASPMSGSGCLPAQSPTAPMIVGTKEQFHEKQIRDDSDRSTSSFISYLTEDVMRIKSELENLTSRTESSTKTSSNIVSSLASTVPHSAVSSTSSSTANSTRLDTSSKSSMVGSILLNLRSWILLLQVLWVLLTRSSTYSSAVRRVSKFPPEVGKQTAKGRIKSLETSDSTDNVPDDDLQVDSVPDVLESKGLHLQVVVTNTTKAVPTSDDSLLYSSHPPDPGSLLCLSDLTETRPGPRRKGRIKLVKGS